MTEPTDPLTDWLAGHPVEPLSPRPGDFDRIAQTARRRRFVRAAATGAAVLLVVAGVAAVIHPISGPVVDPGTTTTARPSSVAPTSAPAVAGPTASATGDGHCGLGQLRVTLEPGDSAAGHLGLRLVFTNTSAGPCTLTGYPGVSFMDSPNGTVVNQPAQSTGGPPGSVTLPPGAFGHADLLLTQVGNFSAAACHPVTAAGLRVSPPNEAATVFVPSAQQLCSVKGTGVPQIYPVQPG